MNQQDAEAIIAIAALAALADGRRDASEHAEIAEAATRLGLAGAEGAVRRATSGDVSVPDLARMLSDDTAKHAAYDTAVAVCGASGSIDSQETAFLDELARSLGIDDARASRTLSSAMQAVSSIGAPPPSVTAPVPGQGRSGTGAAGGTPTGATAVSASGATATPSPMDAHILDQAILTAALELLPDSLANMGILPLQLRLVRHIGQQHGQALDASAVKDLAATFGIGATAQIMESMVRRTLGGLAGGLLGGMLGGAAGIAAGGAVTFAATYSLGHAAQQYYEQGRKLSTADLKALFARFQAEASTIYPRVQDRINAMARSGSVESLMKAARG
jgi:tellurite resistance protein/uncharacterized protein (DUF697 family)